MERAKTKNGESKIIICELSMTGCRRTQYTKCLIGAVLTVIHIHFIHERAWGVEMPSVWPPGEPSRVWDAQAPLNKSQRLSPRLLSSAFALKLLRIPCADPSPFRMLCFSSDSAAGGMIAGATLPAKSLNPVDLHSISAASADQTWNSAVRRCTRCGTLELNLRNHPPCTRIERSLPNE